MVVSPPVERIIAETTGTSGAGACSDDGEDDRSAERADAPSSPQPADIRHANTANRIVVAFMVSISFPGCQPGTFASPRASSGPPDSCGRLPKLAGGTWGKFPTSREISPAAHSFSLFLPSADGDPLA